jgi:hypothetical protein
MFAREKEDTNAGLPDANLFKEAFETAQKENEKLLSEQ